MSNLPIKTSELSDSDRLFLAATRDARTRAQEHLEGPYLNWIETWTDREKYSIQDDAKYNEVVDAMHFAKKAFKQLDEERTASTLIFRDVTAKTNDFYADTFLNDLKSVMYMGNKACDAYQDKKEKEAAAALAAEQAKIDELARKSIEKRIEQGQDADEAKAEVTMTAEDALEIAKANTESLATQKSVSTTMGKMVVSKKYVLDEEATDLMALIKFIADKDRKDLLPLLKLQTSVVNKLLKPTKQLPNPEEVPGINFKQVNQRTAR